MANRFYRDNAIRKHFCIWIERYIDKLKSSKQRTIKSKSRESLINQRTDSKSKHSNRQVNLINDPSKSSVIISQGFLDNVISPNSTSPILHVGNY